MKCFNLSKVFGVSALSLSVVIVSSALILGQSNPLPGRPTSETIPIQSVEAKRVLNLGLFGLLGLLGLAGIHQKHEESLSCCKPDEENYFG